VEAAFLEDYFQKSISQRRFSVALGVFFFMAFGVLDYLMIPQALESIKMIAETLAGSAQAMLDHIVQQVMGFTDQQRPQDDFTIAVLRIGS
jgi:hypothetical protein